MIGIAVARFKRIPHVLIALALFLMSCAISHAQSESFDLNLARNYYLNDLIKPHRYAPGKNSFLLQKLHRGDRKTLLDLPGSGSVRHVWSTWSIPGDDSGIPAPGRVFMRVFVDGQALPAISGPLDELCRVAEATGTRFVPLPAFNYKGAFNLYLPIFFDRGIRIEIEATDEIEEFYTQIDYRSDKQSQFSPRLVSEKGEAGLTLKYLDRQISSSTHEVPRNRTVKRSSSVEIGPVTNSGEFEIEGPGILRELTFRGDALSDLELLIYWDGDTTPAVQAPLRYLFADFVNAAVASKAGQSTCYFPMPFKKKARIVIRSVSGGSGRLTVDYSLEPGRLPSQTLYFHAQYHQTENTVGYAQYSVLQVRGEGLFVGMNLFDSGHNHGGGDAALIDAGTTAPFVLHGICGEDYFGFAWHRTGTMTPLTGAPAHERRYRLHLENPYPFQESIQFLFGVFASQHPKSVAFWYQLPRPAPRSQWSTFDVPWKILGPFGVDTSLPDAVSGDTYPTIVPIKEPTTLEERWQDAEMRSGFFDATYQFRHYAMVEKGTGFVAGAGQTRMLTYVYSPSQRKVQAILGHDDRASVRLNHRTITDLPARSGFGPNRFTLPLRFGWNKLDLAVYNDENVNWRWCGISLALDRRQSHGITFAARPPAASQTRLVDNSPPNQALQ